jgi:hypothetical protein
LLHGGLPINTVTRHAYNETENAEEREYASCAENRLLPKIMALPII